jgi:hypothetical protein
MKKFILLFGFAAMMASCQPPNKTAENTASTDSVKIQPQAVVANTDTLITLNGIDQRTAEAMINYFVTNKKNDSHPTRKSIWFDHATIKNIVELLYKEKAQDGKNRPDTIDGVSVFFASDPSIKGDRLKNSVILLPTRYAGPNKNTPYPSKSYHMAYYGHSKKDVATYILNNAKGVQHNYNLFGSTIRLENLYNICLKCGDTIVCEKKQPHYITRKKGHKMVNQFGKDTIRTRSEWFDLTLLKAFADDNVHDGVRIYFTRHPASSSNDTESDSLKEAFTVQQHNNILNNLKKHIRFSPIR